MSSEQRLLYLLARPDYFTQRTKGAITHALGVVEGFAECGWRVEVLSSACDPERHGADLVVDHVPERVRFHDIGQQADGSRVPAARWDRHWRARLLERCREMLGGSSVDVLVYRYALSQPILAWRLASAARAHASVSVIEVNSIGYHMFPSVPRPVRRLLRWLECRVVRRFDHAYVVSEALGQDLIDGGVPAGRIVVVPNASSPLPAERRARLNAGPARTGDATRFVYAGAFHVYYDFALLIRAFRALPAERRATLHFYGYGAMESRMRDAAGDDERIVFHGAFERSALPDLLDGATDVFVLPYGKRPTAGIGSPIKLFEYMAIGLPIVASRIGQIEQVLGGDDAAWFYDADSVDSASQALGAVAHDADRLARGQVANQRFLAGYTWSRQMTRLIEAVASPQRNGR